MDHSLPHSQSSPKKYFGDSFTQLGMNIFIGRSVLVVCFFIRLILLVVCVYILWNRNIH